MDITLWGVRGSVAVSGPQVAKMGGNTSCVELESQGHRLILDAGTGVRGLGEKLALEGRPQDVTLLFSHLHWDHLQGFPFFGPAYAPSTSLTMYGPGANGAATLASALERQMEAPTFPVPLSAMQSRRSFLSARANHRFDVGPFRVTPLELPHPQGCLGYRIEADGSTFVYCTDVELTAAALTGSMARGFEGADVLVLDAQYSQTEYETKKGWGHSTNVDAAKIAAMTGVRRLLLFHHDPSHTDGQVEQLAEEAKEHFALTEPAREGLKLKLMATP